MPRVAFPQRIEFGWLARTLPTVDSIEQYEEIVAELRRRGWRELTPPSNFIGMMEAQLPLRVQQEAIRRRNAA